MIRAWPASGGLAYKMLKDAGAAPPWIEADKEARARMAGIDAFIERAAATTPGRRARLATELATLVREANAAIARVNSEAPTDRQHRRPLDPRMSTGGSATRSTRLERGPDAMTPIREGAGPAPKRGVGERGGPGGKDRRWGVRD